MESHRKACTAIESGKFKEEIVPVAIKSSKGSPNFLDRDENHRADTTLEELAKLKPVLGGVCIVGNSSSENDGVAVVIVTSQEKAKQLGVEPLAYIKKVE